MTCPTFHPLTSSLNVYLHVHSRGWKRELMSVTALTSHAEMLPCVASALVGFEHHSLKADERLPRGNGLPEQIFNPPVTQW